MHQLRFSAAAASLVLACALLAAPAETRDAAGATTATGSACQKVLPGSNSKLAFKATGVRNESATTGSSWFAPCRRP